MRLVVEFIKVLLGGVVVFENFCIGWNFMLVSGKVYSSLFFYEFYCVFIVEN